MNAIASVGIVAVGDELLAGAHADLNSPYLASRMLEFGRSVRRIFVVGDDEEHIAIAVDRAAEECALVFVSGGLGPTLDDVTRHGVAKSLRDELVESTEAWAELCRWFERAGRPIVESNRRQALIPSQATPVPNAFGTAPGFRGTHRSGAEVIVLPGPPRELQSVFDAEVAPWLETRPADDRFRAKVVMTYVDLSESVFAEGVGAWMDRSANPLVGVTVKEGILTASCVATADSAEDARALAGARAEEIRALFPEAHLGGAIADLGAFVGAELVRLGISFTVAESCTVGAVAAALGATQGLSGIFKGSYVTYDNALKHTDLSVPSEVLRAHGAVSAPCAAAMAEGALRRAEADLAVSITGIAGPDGGTDQKPVGLVWFGVAARTAGGDVVTRTVERRWPPVGRERVRRWARNKALALLLEAARA